jgi:hypothetical protein
MELHSLAKHRTLVRERQAYLHQHMFSALSDNNIKYNIDNS